jgi:RimJ/RimL family protein N-acetyltransferase
VVLADERLHEFTGGQPASHAELLARYERWAAGSPDPGQVWLNWVIRRREDGQPVGTVQATVVTDGGTTAYVAWVVGTPWQGQGFAAEAAIALVAWLRAAGAAEIVAHIHPEHRASAAVAARAGLRPTDETADGERVWRLPPPA